MQKVLRKCCYGFFAYQDALSTWILGNAETEVRVDMASMDLH